MLRSLRIWSLCAVAALGTPATSHAGCLDWLFGCRSCNYCDPCCGGGGVTTYRPIFPRLGFRRAYFAGYAGHSAGHSCCSPCTTCSPCPTPCCTQYVPQTSYRACYVNVPVTTCQAVCATDPCTGCPVTVMRPVTTCVQQVRYTPVVTYRPVCPTPCCSPCDSCNHGNGAHGALYGAPCIESAVHGTTTFSPGGSCCSGGATVVPSTMPAGVVPSTVPSTMPVLPNGTAVPQTFQGSSSGYYRAPAVPAPRPALTTELPQRTWTFRPVSAQSQQPAPARSELTSVETKGADGWRAAKR